MLLSGEKPRRTSEIIGNPSATAAAREWALAWVKGERRPPLLVWGPTGTGKTALAHAIASEFGWEIFEFNASDLRDEASVSKTLANSISSSTISGAPRLILIDDADALSGTNDRGGAGAMARAIESPRQPTILTAVDYYGKKLQSLRSRCQPVQLRKVHPSSIASLLRRVSAEKGGAMPDSGIEKIAAAASGDVRAALNDLQGKNTGAIRDGKSGAFETVRAILKSDKYSQARAAGFSAEADHDFLKLWVAHNLPLEYELPFDVAEGYSWISRADVFDGRIKRAQYWGYLRYSGDLLTAGVATAKTQKYHKFVQISFPAYVQEMGSSKSSRALRKSILQKIGRACHCSIPQAAGYLPLVRALSGESMGGVGIFFGFEPDELDFVSGGPKAAGRRGSGASAAKKLAAGAGSGLHGAR